jgi:transposase
MATTAIGVDTHKDTLAACLVDGLGMARDEQAFANDRAGHTAFAGWVTGLADQDLRIGVEGSSSYGAALARHLVTVGLDVVEVPPQLSRRERGRTRRPGKSDPGDAFAIARVTLAEPDLPPVRLADRTRDLQLLAEARETAVHAQTGARNRLHAHLLVLVPGYTATAARMVSGPELARARGCCGDGTGSRSISPAPSLPRSSGWAAAQTRSSASSGGWSGPMTPSLRSRASA